VLLEREHLLARLTALLEESSGDGRLVFLAGEAGAGQSALVAALVAAVPTGVRIRSRCGPRSSSRRPHVGSAEALLRGLGAP
jgi:AAA ATPase domain